MDSDDFLGLLRMELNPANSNKWNQTQGGYQLIKYSRPRNSSWQCPIL
ncbi:hypothetical protein XIS1_1580031 [Xenorhabdus innexi]|uniref:Uncharacterized protein n=2 Tax=Xenorhabdus innexi TaxID=290109 RepID=A0A1N6MUR2_9GAMM|nr:hypothetical protein Xinn_03020 [Xenorhabdus innexi]SIP72623.1 hypothetical protein XIS1_1580031 [Xenorhabdus innexi]